LRRRKALRRTFTGANLRRSIIVGIVVGTILNVINQGDHLLAADQIVWWRLILTYCVPFCVASFGAYSALLGEPTSN